MKTLGLVKMEQKVILLDSCRNKNNDGDGGGFNYKKATHRREEYFMTDETKVTGGRNIKGQK